MTKGNKLAVNRFWQAVIWVAAVVISAAMRRFSMSYLLGGEVALRIDFDGAVLAFVAATCGPLYGALAYMESDVLGYLLSPVSTYLPQVTVVAACKGLAIGILWRLAKQTRTNVLGVICAAGFFLVTIYGSLTVGMTMRPGALYARWQTAAGGDAFFLIVWLIVGGCIGIITVALAYILHDRFPTATRVYLRSLWSLVFPTLAGTLVTTLILNRYVLTYTNLFNVMILPRLGKDVLISSLNALIMAVLYMIFRLKFETTDDDSPAQRKKPAERA